MCTRLMRCSGKVLRLIRREGLKNRCRLVLALYCADFLIDEERSKGVLLTFWYLVSALRKKVYLRFSDVLTYVFGSSKTYDGSQINIYIH